MTQESTILQNGLHAEADSITPSADLAGRILAATTAPAGLDQSRPTVPARRSEAWRNWILPVAAAGVIAVLLGAVLIGTKVIKRDDSTANVPSPQPSPTVSLPTSPVPSPSGSPTTSPSQPSSPANGAGPAAVPAGFRVLDLSWISNDEGWALSSPICSADGCVAVAHTIDGGRSWTAVRTPDFSSLPGTACDPTCINHIRFANAQVGYAFSEQATFLTSDGGRNWQRLDSGSYALEVANGSVLRLVGQAPGCAPGCRFTLQRAAVGSDDWTTISLPGAPQNAVRAVLARTGATVALGYFQHTAGGGENAQSTIITSTDNGEHWTNRSEPCPQDLEEFDTTALTAAADGSLVVICADRGPTQRSYTMVSTDSGAHFTAGNRIPGAPSGPLVAASSRVLFVGGQRTADGGQSWNGRNDLDPAMLSMIFGFESTVVGRAGLSTSGSGSSTVWTTTDAGASWQRSFTFQ